MRGPLEEPKSVGHKEEATPSSKYDIVDKDAKTELPINSQEITDGKDLIKSDDESSNDDVDTRSHTVKYDVKLNAEKWEKVCKELSDSEEEEDLRYDPSLDQGINPGEVDPEFCGDYDTRPPDVDNVTNLDFTATFAEPQESIPNEAISSQVKIISNSWAGIEVCREANCCNIFCNRCKKSVVFMVLP